MPERAEIEAAAEALSDTYVALGTRSGLFGSVGLLDERSRIRVAEVILDSVRDARGDDEDPETRREIEELKAELRSPQAEDHENCPDCWDGRPKWAGTMPAPPCPTCGGTGKIPWSPQREDHEVGIEAARQVLHGYVWHERLSDVTRATVAAYPSRVSPSRDGTVAVEDVVAAARALRWNVADPYGDDTNIIVEGASWRELQRALAEFGPARAGESNEGGH